jgi:hypothetical protein
MQGIAIAAIKINATRYIFHLRFMVLPAVVALAKRDARSYIAP